MLKGLIQIAQYFNLSTKETQRRAAQGTLPGVSNDWDGVWVMENQLVEKDVLVVPSPYFDYPLPDDAVGVALLPVSGPVSGLAYVGGVFKGARGKKYARIMAPISGAAVHAEFLYSFDQGDAGWQELRYQD